MSTAGYGVRIPADVEKADLILGRMNARQVAVLATAGVLAWAGYSALRAAGAAPLVALGAMAPLVLVGVVLAFGRSAGVSADQLALLAIRHARTPRRQVPAGSPAETGGVDGGLEDLLPPVLVKSAGPSPARMAEVAEGISPGGHLRLGRSGAAVVAACGTVNFHLRTPEEQDGLTGAFARYLNSITGTVQIVVRARRLNVAPVIRELRAGAASLPHPALEAAALEHAAFLAQLASSRDLLARQVLLVARDPSADESGRAARLARRVEEAARALSGAGIAVAALGPVELAAVMAQGGGTDEAALETDYEIESEGDDSWA